MKRLRAWALAGPALLGAAGLTGCGVKTRATPEEIASFEGKPMPPQVKEYMARRQRSADEARAAAMQRARQAQPSQSPSQPR
ncbi:MAG: hypothetical protein IT208_12940 [Chthonomonadales bacterium]|nr:hypothetical protein [Chthonomonadales bacterium]